MVIDGEYNVFMLLCLEELWARSGASRPDRINSKEQRIYQYRRNGLLRSLCVCGTHHIEGPKHDALEIQFLRVLGFCRKRMRVIERDKLLLSSIVSIRRFGAGVPVGFPSILVVKNALFLNSSPLEFSRVWCLCTRAWIRFLSVVFITLDLRLGVVDGDLHGMLCYWLGGQSGISVEGNANNNAIVRNASTVPCFHCLLDTGICRVATQRCICACLFCPVSGKIVTLAERKDKS